MSAMLERISQELTEAMRSRDETRLSTLRMLKAALTNAQIAGKGELSDEAAVAALQREAKQRHESAEAYRKAGDEKRAEQEETEQAIIKEYLPEQLLDSELDSLVAEAIQTTGATSPAQMGAVMGWLKPKVSGRADGGALAARVKERLSETKNE